MNDYCRENEGICPNGVGFDSLLTHAHRFICEGAHERVEDRWSCRCHFVEPQRAISSHIRIGVVQHCYPVRSTGGDVSPPGKSEETKSGNQDNDDHDSKPPARANDPSHGLPPNVLRSTRLHAERFRFVGWWIVRRRSQSRPFHAGCRTIHGFERRVTELTAITLNRRRLRVKLSDRSALIGISHDSADSR